jgi:hypothetical protein
MLGKRFGKLVVLEKLRSHPQIKKDGYYRCRCDCGTICEARATSLRKGHKRSCGCLAAIAQSSPWVGRAVGQLTVVEKLEGKRYRCVCACGREIVSTSMWSRNKTAEAGGEVNCRGPAHSIVRGPKIPKPRGCASKHELYSVWRGIMTRCLNVSSPAYPVYGGRGITICSDWANDFWAFAVYVDSVLGVRPSSGHSIDRVNNNSGYEPENIRWATSLEQGRNTRNCRPFRYKGVLWPAHTAAFDAWVADGRPDCWEFRTASMSRRLNGQLSAKERGEAREAADALSMVLHKEKQIARGVEKQAQRKARLDKLLRPAKVLGDVLRLRGLVAVTLADVDVLVTLCLNRGVAPTRHYQITSLQIAARAAARMPHMFSVDSSGDWCREVRLLSHPHAVEPALSSVTCTFVGDLHFRR